MICLRALKQKTGAEVAKNLRQIFCERGCPKVVQSDNGREFRNSLVEELISSWGGKFVHGRPRNPAVQGSIERANRDIKVLSINIIIFHTK
jgi:hypothetical protein